VTEVVGTDLEVSRSDLRRVRVRQGPVPTLRPGEVLLQVDRFGCTTNNITYARLGDRLGYWDFFPADSGWGRIPVWGFAEAVASACDHVREGTRVFGYLPMSTHLVVAPARADETGFLDGASHRAALPRAYNAYRRTDTDPAYEPRREAAQLLLRPLFLLSFVLADFLVANDLFGAERVVMSSASSKTALGTAFLLAEQGVEIIGLTSAANVGSVRDLHLFRQVPAYDDVQDLPAGPTVFLDFAGNDAVRHRVHAHYRDRLRHSALVGATHRTGADHPEQVRDLPGPQPQWFFAPDRIRMRTREWGRAGMDARVAAAWRPFLTWCDRWLQVRHAAGTAEIERVYLELLDGRSPPMTGHVCAL
jgi:hypothetical protein